MTVDSQQVLGVLTRQKCQISALGAPREPGVYALFLNAKSLGEFVAGADGLVYVGTSENLAQREFDTHFNSKGTGFSTVRRSFGAILKQKLQLKARARGRGLTRQDLLCYVFDSSGERRLTEWMERNVQVAVHPTREAEVAETSLISFAEPLLNLTKWKNPYRTEIKRLRAICVDEAGTHT
jgi:hypothetical protein